MKRGRGRGGGHVLIRCKEFHESFNLKYIERGAYETSRLFLCERAFIHHENICCLRNVIQPRSNKISMSKCVRERERVIIITYRNSGNLRD